MISLNVENELYYDLWRELKEEEKKKKYGKTRLYNFSNFKLFEPFGHNWLFMQIIYGIIFQTLKLFGTPMYSIFFSFFQLLFFIEWKCMHYMLYIFDRSRLFSLKLRRKHMRTKKKYYCRKEQKKLL